MRESRGGADRRVAAAVAAAVAVTVAAGVGLGFLLGSTELSGGARLALGFAFVALVVAGFLAAFAAHRRGRPRRRQPR